MNRKFLAFLTITISSGVSFFDLQPNWKSPFIWIVITGMAFFMIMALMYTYICNKREEAINTAELPAYQDTPIPVMGRDNRK